MTAKCARGPDSDHGGQVVHVVTCGAGTNYFKRWDLPESWAGPGAVLVRVSPISVRATILTLFRLRNNMNVRITNLTGLQPFQTFFSENYFDRKLDDASGCSLNLIASHVAISLTYLPFAQHTFGMNIRKFNERVCRNSLVSDDLF